MIILLINLISIIKMEIKDLAFLNRLLIKIVGLRKNETSNQDKIEEKSKSSEHLKIIQNNKVKNKKPNNPPRIKQKDLQKSQLITNSVPSFGKIIQTKNKIIPKSIKKFSINEINSLPYLTALKCDRRKFLKMYIDFLIVKHSIIFTFLYNKDYNSKGSKISLLFMSFATSYTINTFFFNEETMHQIYEDKGKFNLSYQMRQIIYSTLISITINILLNYLALTDKTIIDLKRETENIQEKTIKTKKCISIRFKLYFILCFTLNLFYWYFQSCFCNIFRNTQIHILKDTIISYLLSVLYPLGLALIPTILRYIALKKENRNCIYKLSTFLN